MLNKLDHTAILVQPGMLALVLSLFCADERNDGVFSGWEKEKYEINADWGIVRFIRSGGFRLQLTENVVENNTPYEILPGVHIAMKVENTQAALEELFSWSKHNGVTIEDDDVEFLPGDKILVALPKVLALRIELVPGLEPIADWCNDLRKRLGH